MMMQFGGMLLELEYQLSVRTIPVAYKPPKGSWSNSAPKAFLFPSTAKSITVDGISPEQQEFERGTNQKVFHAEIKKNSSIAKYTKDAKIPLDWSYLKCVKRALDGFKSHNKKAIMTARIHKSACVRIAASTAVNRPAEDAQNSRFADLIYAIVTQEAHALLYRPSLLRRASTLRQTLQNMHNTQLIDNSTDGIYLFPDLQVELANSSKVETFETMAFEVATAAARQSSLWAIEKLITSVLHSNEARALMPNGDYGIAKAVYDTAEALGSVSVILSTVLDTYQFTSQSLVTAFHVRQLVEHGISLDKFDLKRTKFTVPTPRAPLYLESECPVWKDIPEPTLSQSRIPVAKGKKKQVEEDEVIKDSEDEGDDEDEGEDDSDKDDNELPTVWTKGMVDTVNKSYWALESGRGKNCIVLVNQAHFNCQCCMSQGR